MNHSPTVWITGLSRSGKTELAHEVAKWMRSNGTSTEILDGRAVREQLGDFLGYSRDQRMKVSRIICVMASHLNRHGVGVVATSITPYQESRDLNRTLLDQYFEVFLDCPVEVCIERDESGNYDRALRGDLKHFIGVDDPFEIPRTADLVIDTSKFDGHETAKRTIDALGQRFGQ